MEGGREGGGRGNGGSDGGREGQREGQMGGRDRREGGEKLLETRSVIVIDVIPETPALQCEIHLLGRVR